MILPDIRILHLGSWYVSPDGTTEHRLALGQSSLGFHHSVERSRLGGDDGEAAWSDPFPSYQAAKRDGEQELYSLMREVDDMEPPPFRAHGECQGPIPT